MLAPKQIAKEVLDELSIHGRKDASEFVIHRWKLKAKSLEKSDLIESQRLLAIIAMYENNFLAAENYFKNALTITNGENSLVLSSYGQALIMQGRGLEGIPILVKTFNLAPSKYNLEKVLAASTTLLYIEVIPEVTSIVKRLNVNTEMYLKIIDSYQKTINGLLSFLSDLEVSVKSYRMILDLSDATLYKKFYTQTRVGAYRNDGLLNTIIYPDNLTKDNISEINDDFIENLINLDVSSDDMVKLSVYFSFDSKKTATA
jgi:tetratricopeptide (TPR) repeat protein